MTNKEQGCDKPFIRVVPLVISLTIFLNSFSSIYQGYVNKSVYENSFSHINYAKAIANASISHNPGACAKVQSEQNCRRPSCSIVPSQPECVLESQSINYSEIYRYRQNTTR
jgi:hypothetical protein